MIEVKIIQVEFEEPYNKILEDLSSDLSEEEIENHPYFRFKSNYLSIIRFKTEEEYKIWFKKNYEELLEFEHWVDENEKETYICWGRNEYLNLDITLHIVR